MSLEVRFSIIVPVSHPANHRGDCIAELSSQDETLDDDNILMVHTNSAVMSPAILGKVEGFMVLHEPIKGSRAVSNCAFRQARVWLRVMYDAFFDSCLSLLQECFRLLTTIGCTRLLSQYNYYKDQFSFNAAFSDVCYGCMIIVAVLHEAFLSQGFFIEMAQ